MGNSVGLHVGLSVGMTVGGRVGDCCMYVGSNDGVVDGAKVGIAVG